MASGKASVTASNGLNVRSGAGTQYSKIGALANGTTVSFSAEQNGWLKINYSNKTGYICKEYTKITQTTASSSTPATSGGSTTSTASTSKTMYTNADTLNVRKGPGTSYGIVGTLSYGSKVTVVSTESNGWCKIKYNSGTAYVSGKYVQDKDPKGGSTTTTKPQTTETKPATTESKTTTVALDSGSSLNIRSAPNTSCDIIGTLHNGDKVTYTEDKNGWLKITSPKAGYISRTYTKLNPETSKPSGTSSGNTGTIGAGGLHYLTTKQVASIETGRKMKEITDLTTKKKFNVSWDACATYHSDCTPWTSADTTVIKSILNPSVSPDNSYWKNTNNWSWAGRPGAIQLKDGTWVACGFHLRPHAAIMGGNPGYPFQNQSNTRPSTGWAMGGHFCLYYGDSPGGTPDCNAAAKRAKDMSR